MPHCIKGTGLFRITACTGGPPRTISTVSVCQGVLFFLLSPCIILLNDSKISHEANVVVLTTLGQVSRFTASVAKIFQKDVSVNSILCPYLQKNWLRSMCVSFENLVMFMEPYCEFSGQTVKDMRCLKKMLTTK